MLSLCLSSLIGFIGALIAKPKNVPPLSYMAPPNPQRQGNRWEPSSHKNKEKDEYEDNEYEKSSNLADVSAEKIKALNKLKEDDLITEEEYREKRKKLLEDMF